MKVRRKKGAIVLPQTGFAGQAVALLQRHRLRITAPRLQVVRVLAKAETPLTPYGVHQEIVASGGKTDVVSVYRALDTLTGLGLVHHVGVVNGYVACRLEETHGDQAEHVVCSKCGKVRELTIPDEVLEATRRQLAELGLEAIETRLEILADCGDCGQA
ncbi:MAG: transcriptional repressor [Armatimonadetes bacterium]|nr:transcriptional repressor [Armatimonadota bacterium]